MCLMHVFTHYTCLILTLFCQGICLSNSARAALAKGCCVPRLAKAGAFAYERLHAPPNTKRRTPNAERSPQSRCPTNSIHNRLAETYFRHWLAENLLSVQLIPLSDE